MNDKLFWIPGEQSNITQYLYKPDGSIIIDGQEVGHTRQCCHCGRHWIPVKGSKKIRGHCGKCKKDHCGDIECWKCSPYLEKVERKKERKHGLSY